MRRYEVQSAAASDPEQLESGLQRSEEIHDELWTIVEDNVRQGNESDIMGLQNASANEVIDVHTLRLVAVNLRLPRLVGILVYSASIFLISLWQAIMKSLLRRTLPG